jgi:hypothetical protein
MALIKNSRQFTRRISGATFVLVLTLLFAAVASAQSASFAGKDYPQLGANHVAADFNGDGKPDLAGAGVNVRVMLGNGDGTFRPAVEYPAGGNLQDIATGDLNGDGKLDLVATNLDPNVGLTVLLGNGDGTFGAPLSSPNDTGFDGPSVAVGDFDHDSRLDVVVAHQISCFTAPCRVGNSVTLWRGIGDGTFQAAQQIPVGPGPTKLAAGDFNNDGNADLGIAAINGKVFILLGNGDGTFRQLPDLLIVQSVDNTDIDAGEFNGDGIQDLVIAADSDHRTVILLGNGDGTFRVSASIPDKLQERPGQQTIADFNGDTFQDVAIGMTLCCSLNGDGMIGVLYGNGDGTFKPVVRYLVPGFVIGNAGGSLVATDLNGDGKKDIALQVRGNNPGLTALLNSTGVAPAPVALGSVQITPSSVIGSTQAEVNVSLAPGAVAPGGSIALTISSSNTSVVSVPTGIRIIAGMNNVRFMVDTSRVTAPQTVTITASSGRGGTTRSATLTVTPPTDPLALGSVQMQPAGVFGGGDATGIVNLTTGNTAPSGGATVSITNDNPSLVTTPFNVVIPAGQSSASFPVHTQQTGLTTPVTITGTFGGVSKSATLTVSAPSNAAVISAVALTPQTVVGGSTQGVQVQVSLDQPAPPEGARITLSSNNPGVVNLPASLQIPSGGTIGSANFTTAAVSTPTQVTIRATFGGSTQSAVLNVTPPAATAPTLTAITLNPTTVTGGGSAQGTVTLSAPASAATTVSLSSSSAIASVPASVNIPAGSSSASFSVGTTSVASQASVTISAVLGGTTRSAALTINPATTTADTVAIQKAEYDSAKHTLRVEASSSRANATLQVFVTSSGQLLGTLSSNGGGKFSGQLNAATNPQNITVRSDLGGSATKAVIGK